MARLLLADDAPESLRCMKFILEIGGHSVQTATDGEEAVAAFQHSIEDRAPYDLVILDLAMPRLNGFDAAAQILALWPGQKIVHLTAFDEPLSVGRAVTLGSLAVWKKPDDVPLLCAKIGAIL